MAFHTMVGVENGRAKIDLYGTFDIYAVSKFLISVETLLETPNLDEIEVHFKNVNCIDSSGLGALLQLREKAASRSCVALLCDYSGSARTILETANFQMLFQTRPARIAEAEKILVEV